MDFGLKMFRKSKATEINEFYTLPLEKNQVAVFYLGVSGIIIRTSNQAVLIDPAGFLKKDEIIALKTVNIVLYTHDHLDHFNGRATQEIFKATATPVMAEAKVAKKLNGKIPTDKLTSAESGKTYKFNDLTVVAIEGIHRGPIMLYQIRIDGFTMFHGGDSGYVSLKDYPSDIAFLPTGRMSPTASPEKAFMMASDLKPQIAIAMHGSEKQKQQFEQKIKESMPNNTVLIIKPFTSKTITIQK